MINENDLNDLCLPLTNDHVVSDIQLGVVSVFGSSTTGFDGYDKPSA
jgi:hypothetical protein